MRTKLKKKESKVKEIEATVGHDGEITYTDPETGEKVDYVVDSMEDYRWVMSECQILNKKGFEVSHRLFDALTHKKPTPYLIVGNPAVYIYREGTMEKQQQIDGLDVEDIIELKAKKARREAEEAKVAKDALKKDIEL
jgi:hypothetical protein